MTPHSKAKDLSIIDNKPTGEVASPTIVQNGSAVIDMKYLVKALVKYNASDLHLKIGRPPLYRINGKLLAMKLEDIGTEALERILFSILTPRQKILLEEKRQIDFSFRVKNLGRFRCNVFFQRGGISAAIRMIPLTVPKLDTLEIPEVVKELCQRPRGLILVTGPTGAGKSTTLAAMVQHINENQAVHILTIEDPIEFVFRDELAIITQREVGSDVPTFADGLIGGLRQDPDVIMIGELRDCGTIQAALTAAETGHLVVATLHTNDAKSTIDRILDVFPSDAQNQIRYQLASTLVAVVSQQLILRADNTSRVPACEIMIKSPAIENYIFKNELEKIPDAIANSNNYYKMQSTNQALEKLVRAETITAEAALRASPQPEDLKLRLSGMIREEGFEFSA